MTSALVIGAHQLVGTGGAQQFQGQKADSTQGDEHRAQQDQPGGIDHEDFEGHHAFPFR
jgi:hypothetical protein